MKSVFKESNGSETRSGEARCTNKVHEHSSTGFYNQSLLKNRFGIYIHWPFCLSKCPYCDFFSQVKKDVSQEEIIEQYLSDLDFYHKMTSDQKVTSIFFGGGTPSLIKPQNIEKIISHIENKWVCSDDIEISLEANPNTNHPNMFSDLKSAGINRLSLGIQSLHDNDLKFLGRTHNSKEAFNAIGEVLKTFDNHSMDLIYALPHQEVEQWKKDIEKTTNFGFKHLSLYQLTIEEGTNFHNMGIETMEEEKASDMYILTSTMLEDAGYNRYEVSNFAKDGFECRHNLIYWEGYDYVGVGKTAHGRIGLNAITHRRNIEKLTQGERAEELIIMGLRLKDGIDKQRFKQICGLDFDSFINAKNLDKLQTEGLVYNDDKNIKATAKGSLVINYIIENIVK